MNKWKRFNTPVAGRNWLSKKYFQSVGLWGEPQVRGKRQVLTKRPGAGDESGGATARLWPQNCARRCNSTSRPRCLAASGPRLGDLVLHNGTGPSI